jgi:ligand-binding sensor protein
MTKLKSKSREILLSPIIVDGQRNSLMLNGMVDLNRDVLMRIIGMISDDVKIRNVCDVLFLFF